MGRSRSSGEECEALDQPGAVALLEIFSNVAGEEALTGREHKVRAAGVSRCRRGCGAAIVASVQNILFMSKPGTVTLTGNLQFGGRVARLCVRPPASLHGFSPGWSLPSTRLVSFDGFISTMNQSDPRPQLG